MPWKPIRQEPSYRREPSFGYCTRFCKDATITRHYVGSYVAKTDLQMTYHLSGYSCNLLAGTSEDGRCMYASECPVIPPKYL